MFVYRSRFLTRGEVWFCEEPDRTRVDWIYHHQRPRPLSNRSWKDFYTLLIDLQKPPAQLFGEIEARTSRRITEAHEKDKLRCERCDSRNAKVIDEVEEMWNRFAIAQKTPLLERRWLEQISRSGTLDLRAAKDQAGELLAYHVVLLTAGRARQLIAVSPYKAVPSVAWRNAVSRANCLIHWQNFLAFRSQGIREFDFGGWYTGRTDIRLLGINRFKKSFGGKIVREYDCAQPVTVRGRILLTAAQVISRIKQTAAAASANPEEERNATQDEEQKISPAFR